MQELVKVDHKELNRRVKYVVSLSKEIPWYARKYKELGIDPDEIKSPQDLLKAYEKGLYTTPEDLYNGSVVYYKHPNAKGPFYTSGTKGNPKEIWINPDDEKMMIPKFDRTLQKIITKNDRVLNCLPKEPAISGYIMNCVLSALGYPFKHAPAQEVGADVEKFLKYYKEINPTVLIGLTTFAHRLPLRLEKVGLNNKNLGINTLVTGAEQSALERRKSIGNEFNSLVYDWYVTSETYGLVAHEFPAFSGEYFVTLPETLLFIVKDKSEVSVGETGDVILTNLYGLQASRPYMILLNYKIGDWAKCLEKEDSGIISSISDIRREVAYLAGGKLDPIEVEKYIEELREYKDELTGEYFIINYHDKERKAVVEIRLESKRKLTPEHKRTISEKIREKIYSTNIPVKTLVEVVKDAKLFIEVTDPTELYKGYEQFIKPGKPKRLLVLPNG